MTVSEYIAHLSERIGECISKGTDYSALLDNGFDDYVKEKIGEMIYHTIWKRKDISTEQIIEHLEELGVSSDCIFYDETEIRIKLKNVTFKMVHSEAYRLGVRIGFFVGNNLFDITRNEENAIARVFLEIDRLYPQWENEWSEIYIEISKLTKNIDIAVLSTNALVRNKLKGSGLQYHLEHASGISHISVKINDNRQICIPIPHNDIAGTISKLPETINKTTALLDQIHENIRINDDSRDDWESA